MKRLKFFTQKEDFLFICILVFFFSIRAVLATQYGVANMFGDEIMHWGSSKSIFQNGTTVIRGIPVYYFFNLYSILLSAVHFIDDYSLSMEVARVFNSAMMILGLIPVYLLSQKMLGTKKKAIWAVVLMALLPEFAYSTKLIQENLQFTLIMWLWYIAFITFEKREIRNRDVMVLGTMSFLCYITKESALSIFVAICIFYCASGIINRKLKFYFLKLIIHILTFTSLTGCYILIYKNINNNVHIVEERFSTIPFSNPMLYVKLIYPTLIYILVLIVISGIFAFIIPTICINKLNWATKQMFGLILTVAIVTIGVVIMLLTRRENFDQSNIRIHIRHLYYVIPPLMIILLQCMRIDLKDYNYKLGVLLGSVLIMMISNINIFAVMGSSIDGNSNKILTENVINKIMNIENYKMMIISFLCIYIIWGIWCICMSRKKLLYFSVFLIYITFCLANNVLSYYEENYQRQNLESYTNQYKDLNAYVHDNLALDENIVILSEFKNSEASLELGLEDNYYLMSKEMLKTIIQSNGIIPPDKIIYEGFITSYDTILNIKIPQFIIKRKDNWNIANYSKVYATADYEVLEKNETAEQIIVESIIEGLTIDSWVQNEPITITLYNHNLSKRSVFIQCFSLKNNLPVRISDNLGNENEHYINPGSNVIEVPIVSESDGPTTLTIVPLDTVRPVDANPNSLDNRYLSINIQNISLE